MTDRALPRPKPRAGNPRGIPPVGDLSTCPPRPTPPVAPPAAIVIDEGRAPIEKPQNYPHANKVLDDGPYVAYVLLEMFRLGTSMLYRRWPEFRKESD